MSKITITLTKDQVDALYMLVNQDCSDNAQDENYYAFMHRIRVKLAKAKN